MPESGSLEIQVVGGLGNQLHGLAAGMVLAKKLGLNLSVNSERVRFGSNMNRRPELEEVIPEGLLSWIKFERNSFEALKFRYEKLRRLSRGALPHLDFFLIQNIVTLEEGSCNKSMKFLAIQKVSGGHFIDFEWADLAVGFGFPKILQPSEPSKTYNEISGELGANTVAIHIRLGDYLQLPDIFPIPSENYYIEALRILGFQKTDPIHVFTDSPRIVKLRYPRLFAQSNIQIIDPNLLLSSVESMILLSRYSDLITSNSTFSSWAGWFLPEKRVVTPTPHLYNNWHDRLPSKWVRLPINL